MAIVVFNAKGDEVGSDTPMAIRFFNVKGDEVGSDAPDVFYEIDNPGNVPIAIIAPNSGGKDTRILIRVPMPGSELPDDPAALGLPTAGPASPQAAHSRLSRSAGNRPKFSD